MTLAMAATAAAIFWMSAERWLIFDRALILEGQAWRGWTGHLVHFTPSHLGWNLAVVIPAGCWLERLWPRTARWYYLLSAPVISVILLIFDSALLRYAGLSGIATGVIVLLAGLQLARKDRSEPVWVWIGLLVLVGAKLGYEMFAGGTLLVESAEKFRNVPLAHLAGAGCGAAVWAAWRTIRVRRG